MEKRTRNVKIAITGASGFIGQYTVLELNAKGHRMVLLGRERRKLDSAFYSNRIPFQLIETDYGHSLEKTLKGTDALIHLAGLRYQKERGMADYVTNNILITDRIFHAAAQSGIRNIVFASTIAVYNSWVNALPFTEDQNCFPPTPYGISKLTCEKIAYWYDLKFGTKIKSLRIGQAIGAEEREGYMVNTMIGQASRKETLTVWGRGSGTRDYVYVKDVAHAITAALELPEQSGVFNIGCGEPISHLRLAEAINRAFGNKGNLKMDPGKMEDAVPFFMSIKKAERELGWKSRWNLESMLADMANDDGHHLHSK